MMNTYALGQRVVLDCCNRKQSILEAITTFDLETKEGIDACNGALDSCVEIIGCFLSKGYRLAGNDGEILNRYGSRDLLMIAHLSHNQKAQNDAQSWNNRLVFAAEAICKQMVVSVDFPCAEPDQPKVIPVAVVSMPAPEKMPVEVVSMPVRETETTVKRDGDGSIVSTLQVERDASV